MVISTANRHPNSSGRYKPGSMTGGWLLGITMRSKGSSKIIGAAIAPIAPLASLVPQACEPREMMTMMTKTAAAAVKVTGVMGSLGVAAGVLRS